MKNRNELFRTMIENLPGEATAPIWASGNRILCYKKSDFDAFCTVCNALGLDTIGGVIGVGKDGVEEDTWFFIALREESNQESRSCNDSDDGAYLVRQTTDDYGQFNASVQRFQNKDEARLEMRKELREYIEDAEIETNVDFSQSSGKCDGWEFGFDVFGWDTVHAYFNADGVTYSWSICPIC